MSLGSLMKRWLAKGPQILILRQRRIAPLKRIINKTNKCTDWARMRIASIICKTGSDSSKRSQYTDGFGARKLIRSARPYSPGNHKHENSTGLECVQVLTRYCEIESPYWQSFLRHYHNLGVTTFHVCLQEEGQISYLRNVAKEYGARVVIHLTSATTDPAEAIKKVNLADIREGSRFTLMVDGDEYLHSLNKTATIPGMFRIYPRTNQISIPWLMCPIIDYQLNHEAKGFWGHMGKPACRTSRLTRILNDHQFQMMHRWSENPEKIIPVGPHGIAITHYWARTFRDCLLKTFNNRFLDSKRQDPNQALALIRADDLPLRLRILAFLSLLHGFIPTTKPHEDMFDLGLEEELLRRSLSEQDEAICREVFNDYRYRLAESMGDLPLYPAVSLRRLAQMLPSACDLRHNQPQISSASTSSTHL